MNLDPNLLKKFSKETIFISSIGKVEPGKNIDFFIIVAEKIKRKLPKMNIKFFWLGDGYSAYDLSYGIWLKEQINLSSLQNDFFIIDNSFYKELFYRSDFFIFTNIQNELPFFAEEALSSSKPILCFDQNSELVEFYKKSGLYNFLVTDYLDIESISEKAVNLINERLSNKKYFSIFSRKFFKYNENKKLNWNSYNKGIFNFLRNIINIINTIKMDHINFNIRKINQYLFLKKVMINKLIYGIAIKSKNLILRKPLIRILKSNKITYRAAIVIKNLLRKFLMPKAFNDSQPAEPTPILEEIHKGKLTFKDSLPTVLVICHEASATGAPILGLNICKNFKEFNIIVLLPKGGELIESFKDNSSFVINFNIVTDLIDWNILSKKLTLIIGNQKIKYAIVNSFVSGNFVFALKILKIPTILLVHEFAGYCDKNAICPYFFWASQILFSTSITRDDFFKNIPALKDATNINILPQGKSEPMIKSIKENKVSSENDSVDLFLRDLSQDTILIMGAGYVQIRKGVGIFIGVANRIRKKLPNKKIKFVWIGGGYCSEDLNLGIWLYQQISLSNLEKDLFIIENSPNYQKLLERSDFFLVTSLLDPLPNVAIDALSAAKPTFCFDRGCGLAEYYKNTDLYDDLVVSFFDIESMSEKIISLIKNTENRKYIYELSCEFAKYIFNMKKYISSLSKYGDSLKKLQKNQLSNIKDLIKYDPIDCYFYSKDFNKNDKFSLYLNYTQSWINEIMPRKPFPGFHPGIYKEEVMKFNKYEDPLLHFLKSGSPKGRWLKNVILPTYKEDKNLLKSNDIKIGIHIHVYYLDLLDEILKAIILNKTKPDLLITTPFQKDVIKIKKKCFLNGLQIKKILVTPNIGRDIGPFVTGVGKFIDSNYDFYAHIHTKKVVHVDKLIAQEWREFLISNLLGNQGLNMIDKIICSFQKDKLLGLVFPDDPNCCSWTLNLEIAKNFGSKMGLKYFPKHFNFPIGTMFWARKNALSPLFNLNLDWDSYPNEPLPNDGTVLHSIERLIPLINESQGFEYSVTNVPSITR